MKPLLPLCLLALLTGCATTPPLLTPRIAVDLPDDHHSPDGLALDSQNNLIIACSNLNEPTRAPWLMKITPDHKLEKWFAIPAHPDTKAAAPLGIAFGSDGHLYVVDCQGAISPAAAQYKSRLLRVVVKDNKPIKCETVAEGFVVANGVACHGPYVYVTQPRLEPAAPKTGPLQSAVYRFRLDELKADKPIKILPADTDPHIVFRITTVHEKKRGGANGIAVAPDGTVYVCNFGDSAVIALTFDTADKLVSNRIVAQGEPIQCADGIKFDDVTNRLYVADLLGNAIHAIDVPTGKITTLAQNGLTDGRDGQLDRPSEICLRGRKLYISNIDLPRDGNVFDKPHNVSVIDLDPK